MTRIKALLLGLGQIGCGYDLDQPFQPDQACSGAVTWTHARALACHPQVELVAAVDPSAQARARFSAVYSCPAFADLEAYFQGPGSQELDLVVVAVPPALQPSLVDQLLARCSPRMLLLEKPVAINVEAAERLRQACNRHPQAGGGGELHPALLTRGSGASVPAQGRTFRRAAARSSGVRQGFAEQWLSFRQSRRGLAGSLAQRCGFGARPWLCWF